MSIQNFFGDVFSGNFSNAIKRLEDWWAGMPFWLKDFVAKAESAEGQLLTSLAETAAADVIAGGVTTASFVAAAKDVASKLEAQEVTFGQQQIFAAINLAVGALKGNPASSSAPSEAPPVSSEPDPAA